MLLNFYASWRLPHKEFPDLLQAVKWAEGRLNLVAVSVDSSTEDMKGFLSRMSGFSPGLSNVYIVWDPESALAGQFHVVNLPETFFLNRNLKVKRKWAGVFDFNKNQTELSRLLSERQ